MNRALQSLTSAMILLFFLGSPSAAAAADSEETLPAPQSAVRSENPPVTLVAPRGVIVEPAYRFEVRTQQRNPVQVYRNGRYGRHFGDYYRDRNGGFFYGYDSRYRFGIHR